MRQMVFRSFLELDWERAPKVKAFVPEEFVLGPFLSALDDPVHHQEIGTFYVDNSSFRKFHSFQLTFLMVIGGVLRRLEE